MTSGLRNGSECPAGRPMFRMRWSDLLFIHRPVDPALLQPLIPAGLEIDTFGGSAWVGLVPFTMEDVLPAAAPRFRWLGRIPALTAFHECNVRTYVRPVRRADGRGGGAAPAANGYAPGVWFFSLDATSRAGVWAARRTHLLRYHVARIHMRRSADEVTFAVQRIGAPGAFMRCAWRIGAKIEPSQPGSLAHFLTERYCLYTADARGRILCGRIRHDPWPLRAAELLSLDDGLVRAAGIEADSATAPTLHCAHDVLTHAWGLATV